MGLNLVDGRGHLSLQRPQVVGAFEFEKLELEIPHLRFPFDASGGAGRFRHRRCKLQTAMLRCNAKATTNWLQIKAAPRAIGFEQVRAHFLDGSIELQGQVALGEAHADFLFRVAVHRLAGRELRVALYDLRLFGAFPVAAPRLAAALVAAALPQPPRGSHSETLPLVQIAGCCDVEVAPLQLLLLEMLPGFGWRVPALDGVTIASLSLTPEGLSLFFSRPSQDGPAVETSAADRHLRQHQEAKQLFEPIEADLMKVDDEEAIQRYSNELERHPGHPFLLERLLQLSSADPRREEQTLELAREANELNDELKQATLLARATVALRRGDNLQAGEIFSEYAELADSDGRPRELMLGCLNAGRALLSGAPERAAEHFERVLELDPDHMEALNTLGRLYAELGQWPPLVQVRKKQVAAAKDGEHLLNRRLSLGELYRVHVKDIPRALEQYELALEIDPACEPALHGLAEACIDADTPVRAIAPLDRLCTIAQAQGDIETAQAIHMRIASLWRHLADPESALGRLKKAQELHPRDPAPLRRMTLLLLELGRHREASRRLKELLNVSHEPAERLETHKQLARLYLGPLDDTHRAAEQLERALALDMLDTESLELRINLAEKLDDNASLLEALRQAADAEPVGHRKTQLLTRRGTLLIKTGAHAAEAALVLTEAAETTPDQAFEALQALALLQERSNDLEAALGTWNRALGDERSAALPTGWLHLGRVLSRKQRFEEAIEALEHALDLSPAGPEEWNVLSLLADCHGAQGDQAKQLHALRLLLPLFAADGHTTEQAKTLATIAALLEKNGEAEKARLALKEAVSLLPDNPGLLQNLGALHHRLGQLEEARECLELAFKLYGEEGNIPGPVVLQLAAVAAQQGHNREAIAFYQRALDGLRPDEVDSIYGRIVDLHLRGGDPVSAAQACEAAAACHENARRQAQRYHDAGQIWLKRATRQDEAIRCFKRALDAWPQHRRTLDALEFLANQRGDDEELVEILRKKVEAANQQPAVQKALLVRLAEKLQDLGRLDEAHSANTNALNIDSNYLPALLFAARRAWDEDSNSEATRRYQQVLEQLAATEVTAAQRTAILVEGHLRVALGWQARGAPRQCEIHLQLVLEVDPLQPEALEVLDALLHNQQRWEDLEGVLQRRLQLSPTGEMAELQSRLARVLVHLGRIADAVDAYDAVLADWPRDDTLAELQALLEETGDHPRLVQVLTRYAKSLQGSDRDADIKADAWLRAARAAAEAGELNEYLIGVRQALSLAPQHVPALELLLQLSSEGVVDDDRTMLLGGLIDNTTEPNSRRRHLDELVALLEERGEIERASHALHTAAEQNWASPAQRIRRGEILEQLNQPAHARSAYLEILDQGEAEASLKLLAAKRLLELLDEWAGTQEKVSLARKVLALDQHHAPAWETLVRTFQDERRWPDLVEVLEAYLPQIPPTQRTQATCRLALALDRSERAEEAEETLRSARASTPPKELVTLAEMAQDLGFFAVERLCLDQAEADLSRENLTDAKHLLRAAELATDAGDTEQGQALLLQLVEQAPTDVAKAAARRLLDVSSPPPLDPNEQALSAHQQTIALELLHNAGELKVKERWTLAQLLAQQHRSTEALAVADGIPGGKVGADDLRSFCWAQLAAIGDYERLARRMEQRARGASAPLRAEGLLAAAHCWAERAGDIEEASRCAREAAEATPDSAEVITHVVGLFSTVGAWERGSRLLEQLASPDRATGPRQQASALCHAAELLLGSDPSNPRSEAFFRQALQRDPLCRPAHEALVALFEARGEDQLLVDELLARADLGETGERAARLLRGADVLVKRLAGGAQARSLMNTARGLSAAPEVLERIAELELTLGDPSAAEQTLVALANSGHEPERTLGRACRLAHMRGDSAAETAHIARLAQLKPEDHSLPTRLLEAYRAAGDLQGLARSLRSLAESDPHALLELAELSAGPLEELTSAHQTYELYLKDHPRDLRALEGMATVCERLHRPREQAETLEQLLALQDKSPAHRGKLALRLAAVQRDALDDPEAALTNLRRAQEDLESGELWVSAVRQLAQLLPGNAALEVLAQLVHSGYATADELALLGERAQQAENTTLAIVAYRQLVLNDPNDKRGHQLIPLLRSAGAEEEAAELLEDRAAAALARDQSDQATALLLELADVCTSLEQPERREASLKRALATSPARQDIAVALMEHTREHRGDVALASLIEKVLDSFKLNQKETLLGELVSLYERLGRPEEALRAQEDLYHLQEQPTHLVIPILQRAITARDLPRARTFHQRADALGQLEGTERVHFNADLAALELDVGSAAAAQAMLSLALKLDPSHIGAWQTLQRLGLETNDPRAIGEASIALARLNPEREDHYLRNAAVALRGLEHERERAIDAHQRLLKSDPGDGETADALEELLEAEGDLPNLATLLWKRARQEPTADRWQRLAEVEGLLGRDQHAERALREGIRALPRSYQLLSTLLQFLAGKARWSDMASLLEEKLGEDQWEAQDRAELATRLGLVLIDQLQDLDSGRKWLVQGCSSSAAQDAAFRRLITLHRQQGEFKELEHLLRRRVEQLAAGTRSKPLEELAGLLEQKLGDSSAAADAYEQAYREAPEQHTDALLAAQRLHAQLGDAARALELLEQGLHTISDKSIRVQLQASRAALLANVGQDQQAIEAYEQLLVSKSVPQARAQLGLLLERQGEHERALPHLQAAADRLRDPHAAAEAAFASGRVLEALGLHDEAIARYTQSVERDPAMRTGWEALAALHEGRGDVPARRRALKAIEALGPPGANRGKVRRQLGDIHRSHGEWEACEACYLSSLADDPTAKATLGALEETYASCERWQDAADVLQQHVTVEQDPQEQIHLHRRLAELMLNRLNNLEGAIEQLRATAALADDDIPSRHVLLSIYERQLRFGEAAHLALELAPLLGSDKQRATLLRAARALENAGDVDQAIALYHRLVNAEDEVAHQAAEHLAKISKSELSPMEPGDPARAASDVDSTDDWSPDQHRTMPMPGEVAHGEFVPAPAPERDQGLMELARSESWVELVSELQSRIAEAEDAPHGARLRLQLAGVLEGRLQRSAEALDLCEEAAELAPNDARVIETAAEMLYRHQRWRSAREIYDKLYTMGSSLSRAELCYRLGVAHESLGFESMASDCYTEALALEPEHRDALEARARLAFYRDDPMTAITLLKDLLDQIQPDEPAKLAVVREQLGEVYLKEGALTDARRYLEAALAADPRREKAMHLLLSVFDKLELYGEAARVAQRLVYAVEDPIIRASVLHHHAEILATNLHQEDEAINCLLRAYDIAPSHTPTLWRLLDFYWSERDLQAVVEMGNDLEQAGAIETAPEDLRRVYLAIAVTLTSKDIKRAQALLEPALQVDSGLRQDALAELVMHSTDEQSAALLAELLHTAGDFSDGRALDALEEECPPEEIARLREALARG
ncbi:MAG: tetratricopeptide repeat protein [Deltaproteobacteria bacterium]|nr:tetratricopeptide repeat protein [Deltaproteobacteria bacterium]